MKNHPFASQIAFTLKLPDLYPRKVCGSFEVNMLIITVRYSFSPLFFDFAYIYVFQVLLPIFSLDLFSS
jgi:hypothetical protein